MCYYNSSTTPFLRIAPFKTEQIGLDPYVVVFHDVLSPREISKLISLTDRKLVQAVTVNKKSFKEMVRTAKAHWVYRGYQELTKRIYRRIHDMSGFELADAENFQVLITNLSFNSNLFLQFKILDRKLWYWGTLWGAQRLF